MELNLKDFVSILQIIKNLSWGSIPLWLAIGVPIYYVLIRKAIPDKESPENAGKPNLLQRLKQVFTLPKFEKWVIGVSVVLFIIGSFTVILEQKQSEAIRNNGLRIKKHMVDMNFYCIPDSMIINNLGITNKDIKNVLKQYPNEFLQVKSTNYSANSIMLTDSALYSRIILKSRKLLEAYLSKRLLTDSSYVTMDELFIMNNFFTTTVCYNLLSECSDRYYYDMRGWKHSIAKK